MDLADSAPELADVHKVILLLTSSLQRLGAPSRPREIERAGVAVHQALAGGAREFHTHEHVLAVTEGADPIETLAGLFHDVVYVQVDQGVAGPLAPIVHRFLSMEGACARLTDAVVKDPAAALVTRVFGRAPGEELSAWGGLNELASALVAAKLLEPILPWRPLAEITACIEATIPFRDHEALDRLATRLGDLGIPDFDDDARAHAVRRAVRLGNRDVGTFAEEDPAHFLDNTWKLMPETNPALNSARTHGVGEYRVALQKMEAFLRDLDASLVFHAWGGEPSPEEHARRVAQAHINIALAVRYVGAKLYTISIIEALAEASGGDAPLEFFLGRRPSPDGPLPLRAEYLLEPLSAKATDHDPTLLRLLEEGRASASSFDMPASPITAYLYRILGERALTERLGRSRAWMNGEVTARDYLAAHAGPPVAAIARAVAHLAFTRQKDLLQLAETFGRTSA
jgi:hypothetical protein